jgi:tetratricopeptide (TPR) repeat protein
MEHENIARVLDAGTTDAGRPYFAMELVKGVPITEYCDQNNLTPRQRLGLFVQVCRAVQHAHTKGVIHRDLKPTNILVTLHDGVPVPKVIDFGIAKATGGSARQLTDKTLFTHFAQMIGTPLYMSPEQAELSGLDVDTRSDVYSLGVLLYELLTGTTPFDGKRLGEAALDEVRRIIREEEPPRPSTRLGTLLGETLTLVSAHRRTDASKLGESMRGELDWIVMKSLEKDRTRRYETANGLARDVERFLADETVQACPPSASYRFRKFARRNRAALAAVVLLVVSLILAVGGITAGIGWAARDRTAREEQSVRERMARQLKSSAQLELILNDVSRLEQAEKWSEALVSVGRAEPLLAAGEAAPDIQERARSVLADLEVIRRLDETRAKTGTVRGHRELYPSVLVRAEREYLGAFRQIGIDVDALPVKEAVDQITARPQIAAALLPALDDWIAVRSVSHDQAGMRRLAEVVQGADPDPWRRRFRDALVRQDGPALEELASSPELDRQPAATLSFLHVALRYNNKHLLANEVVRRAQWKHPSDYWINLRLGISLIFDAEHMEEGIGYVRAAIAVRPTSDHAIMILGTGYANLRDPDRAMVCYRRAMELAPTNTPCLINLGETLVRKGLYEEAIAVYERIVELNNHPDMTALAHAELSSLLSSCPEPRLRNQPKAVHSAARAVESIPNGSLAWAALGMAWYRAGHWQDARAAFEWSLQLAPEASRQSPDSLRGSTKWFFLALCQQQLGNAAEARRCYDTGVSGMDEDKLHDAQIDHARRCC